MAFDAQMRLVADDPEQVALIGAQSGERLSQGDLARCIEQLPFGSTPAAGSY